MLSRSDAAATFRRDTQTGGKVLTAQDRLRLVKPYLPPPKSLREEHERRQSRFGIRRFLRNQLHLLVFTLIHAIFSLYIRIRQAYHAVGDQIYAIIYYHHRTPAYIERDIKPLRDSLERRKKKQFPSHISVVVKLEDDSKGGAALEKLVDEVSDIAAWCACAHIPRLSVYERTGILKGYVTETHRAMSKKLCAYFGSNQPELSLRAPHVPSIETEGPSATDGAAGAGEAGPTGKLSVVLLSAEDGRDSIVDLTKTLAEMAQRGKISPADISMDLIDAELRESVVEDPDLLVVFGPHVDLAGFPPWQLRLTEISCVQDSQGVGYQVFLRALQKYSQAEMRFGR